MKLFAAEAIQRRKDKEAAMNAAWIRTPTVFVVDCNILHDDDS
jgi:hypothetical protein